MRLFPACKLTKIFSVWVLFSTLHVVYSILIFLLNNSSGFTLINIHIQGIFSLRSANFRIFRVTYYEIRNRLNSYQQNIRVHILVQIATVNLNPPQTNHHNKLIQWTYHIIFFFRFLLWKYYFKYIANKV